MKNKLYILLILALGMGFSSARAQVIVSGTVAVVGFFYKVIWLVIYQISKKIHFFGL